MGQILIGTQDYDSIRAALGLDKDASKLLTDTIIEAFPHLVAAEAEIFSRSPAGVPELLARDPMDYQRGALKAATCALTCGFLCRRLQITIPIRSKIELGESERQDIDWEQKRQDYINDCNWFWRLTGLGGTGFPVAMDIAFGRLLYHDPIVRSIINGGSNFAGYISPFSGYQYNVSLAV